MARIMDGTIHETCDEDPEYWADGEVDAHFEDVLKQIGEGNKVRIIVTAIGPHNVAELMIDVGDGQAIVRKDNEIAFVDCMPISIDDLAFVIAEARAFIEYRDGRNEDVVT